MEKEKRIGTLIISNEKRTDLFRIHLYEKSIRFDEPFANALAKNKNISEKIMDISKQWGEGKIKYNDVFVMIVNVLGGYEKYLSKYYFSKKELDEKGRFVEPVPILTLGYESYNKDMYEHYDYLKNNDKLVSISKKDFENAIKDADQDVVDFYVDNYPRTKAEYYIYNTNMENEVKNCYLLVVDEKILIGFEK